MVGRMTPPMRQVLINGRWPLLLPEHRAARPEWPWWEATRIAAMWHHLLPGQLIFDVGAEEGDLPALWATWGLDVGLVEPNPRVWPNIKAIWQANGLKPRFAYPGFLDDHSNGNDAGSDLTEWPACAGGPVIGDHGFWTLHEHPVAPRTTVDEWMAAGHLPDALTIDVEGAECGSSRAPDSLWGRPGRRCG